ncbi:MAG: hypothetical protein KDD82_26550, partial [Planctomycetes bacterium]|nr:hypothetical protein [Planctomycetota bacterium]
SAALVWRTLGLGLELGRPLPDALRATRDAFARGSWSWGEVDGLLPAAAEGADLPALLSGLDAEHLREEHLLRVAQERGSLAADVLALAALRREQLLDVARTEGAALLLFADAALMLATAGMLIVLMVGSDGGPFALLRLLQQ